MRTLLWATTLMLRAYPARWREAWAGECLRTFEQSCADVSSTGGPVALLRHILAEWFDMLRGAARLRRSVRRRTREPRRPWRSFRHDISSALRSLRAVPAHSAIAVGTLALGIGANAGLFSVLDSLLFRPVPFAEADRLTELLNYSIKGRVQFPGFSPELLREWGTQTDLFSRVEGYEQNIATFDGAEGAELVDMAYVTPGLLSMLGVAPLEGRIFGDGEGREGTDTRVIVSESLWRERFAARLDFVGTTVRINGRLHDVVGLMPSSFLFPSRGTQMWIPMPERATMVALAQMAPGVTLDRATAEVRARGERLQAAVGGEPGVTAIVTIRTSRDERQTKMLQVLGAAVAFLLLIVCANLANLSLSKAIGRARDVAVRSALGATRRDLIRESLVEHLMLGAIGAILGLSVAWAIVEIANQALPPGLISRSLNPIDLDGRTLAFALIAGVLTPLLFGLPTAILGSRSDVSTALTQQSRSMTGSRAARRWRNGLVVSEVTLAMVLLVGTALMGRSLYTLVSVDRGFETEGLVRLRVGLPAGRYTDPVARDAFSESLIESLRRLPHVTSVTAGHVPPSPSGSAFGTLEFGHSAQIAESVSVPSYRVWPDYFDQIGLPLVDGRAFAVNEPAGSTIVSESFAKTFWPAGSAVGGTFRFTGAAAWRTVVGVATDVRQMGTDDEYGAFEWFVPLRTSSGAALPARTPRGAIVEDRNFVVRTTEGAATLDAMKRAVREIDPTVIVMHAFSGTVDEAFSRAVAQPRLVLVVLATLAGLGLLLAAAGLYGVLSFMVTVRMREFGVRLALGARPESVFRLIVRYGVVMTGVGLVLGGVAATWLVRLMQSVLYEVEPSDPLALIVVALVLMFTALGACWRPARRAMRVDPVSLLRE